MIIFLGFLLVLLGVATYAGFSGATWVPTRARDIDELFKDTKLKPGQLFIELGCGDGRLVREAAKHGAVSIGYEINPLLCLIAKIRCFGHKNARIVLGDLWAADISKADVVMTFLVPRTVGRLEAKAAKEMKKGSRLISYIFRLPQKAPAKASHHWFVYEY